MCGAVHSALRLGLYVDLTLQFHLMTTFTHMAAIVSQPGRPDVEPVHITVTKSGMKGICVVGFSTIRFAR